MKCAIIGWYGTETIGDRAILAGILSILTKIESDMEFYLGAIYPFFSERTLFEDQSFIEEMCGQNVKITIFDSRNHFELKKVINEVDYLFMGGGPLMDVSWMYMIEYAFMKAKKRGIATGLIGCGLGPLYKKTYIKSTYNILNNSDITIFRDRISKESAEILLKNSGKDIISAIDPAVFAAMYYKKNYVSESNAKDYIAVNFRAFPKEYLQSGEKCKCEVINKRITQYLDNLLECGKKINLVPMHYFTIGGDDREYLNFLANQVNSDLIQVQNAPLSLESTMRIFADSFFCVGMRFHSVVLQTIVNGNNYIVDYTEPKRGKTSGFISEIGGDIFYKERYLNLRDEQIKLQKQDEIVFNINENLICENYKKYMEKIQEKM